MHMYSDSETLGETLDKFDIARDDWEFCRNRLEEVSRTFSKPIGMLPAGLSVATTCGYLLCRIADTIEDHPELSFERKRELFTSFEDVLESRQPPSHFTSAFGEVPGEGPYFVLSRALDRVCNVFWRLPDPVVDASTRWIGEMSRGMAMYARRETWSNETTTLETPRDLERYCYFVAGTVGHMLTELFLHEMGDIEEENKRAIHRNAERFGLGLQLVNIIKDQTDDLDRQWCFIPKSMTRRQGLEPTELYHPDNRQAAHRAVAPLFETASTHLDSALEYTLAIPAEHGRVRLACLVPLWLAVRTLVHAKGNDAMFVEDKPVKITREEVGNLIADCVEHASEDAYLRERYGELWQG